MRGGGEEEERWGRGGGLFARPTWSGEGDSVLLSSNGTYSSGAFTPREIARLSGKRLDEVLSSTLTHQSWRSATHTRQRAEGCWSTEPPEQN